MYGYNARNDLALQLDGQAIDYTITTLKTIKCIPQCIAIINESDFNIVGEMLSRYDELSDADQKQLNHQ